MPTVIPIQRLQRADRALGLVACTALQPWRALRRLRSGAAQPEPARRVLLIKFWGLGSLQLLTPAVGTLRRRHPEAELVLLTLSENAAFVRGLGVFDRVEALDVRAPGWAAVALRILALVRRLRRARYERVYDFEFFTRFSAVVSFLVGAPRTTGFSSTSAWRGRLHTDDVPFNRYWHVARNFRALAGGEDGEDVPLGELRRHPVTDLDREGLLARLAEAGLAPDAPLVALNPNAGRLSLERRWPVARFAALARRVLERTDHSVVLVGSEGERAHTREVLAAAGGDPRRLVEVAGRLSLGELSALFERADAVVSNDSGPMHLAAAQGAPTLGLFGPETPQMYRPLGPRAEALYRPTVCSPCINVHQGKLATCIHGHPECLENISVDDAWGWLEPRLAAPAPRPRVPVPAARTRDA
jgi:lipopolysaccharide heptosyltransferase II